MNFRETVKSILHIIRSHRKDRHGFLRSYERDGSAAYAGQERQVVDELYCIEGAVELWAKGIIASEKEESLRRASPRQRRGKGKRA